MSSLQIIGEGGHCFAKQDKALKVDRRAEANRFSKGNMGKKSFFFKFMALKIGAFKDTVTNFLDMELYHLDQLLIRNLSTCLASIFGIFKAVMCLMIEITQCMFFCIKDDEER